jgi:hypothetical protein
MAIDSTTISGLTKKTLNGKNWIGIVRQNELDSEKIITGVAGIGSPDSVCKSGYFEIRKCFQSNVGFDQIPM